MTPDHSRTNGREVVVIGAGIAGLATAALLSAEGYDVTVYEGRDEIGGRAGSWERDGFRFDTGPSWYLMPEVFDHFFRLLGTSAEDELDLVPLTPAYRVFTENEGAEQPLDVVSGRAEAIALFEGIEPGSGTVLDEYLDSAGDAYDLSINRFLYDSYESLGGLTDPELLKLLPRLAPLLTRSLSSYVEKRFQDPRLRQVLGYPAVFLGGSPFGVPSLYHLMSHLDLDEGVLYPRGGLTTVIQAVERVAVRHGVTIRTGAPVVGITTEEDPKARATGIRLQDGTTVAADLVVSTTDLHHTETQLLPEHLRTYPESWWKNKTPSPGALLLLLGVEGELPQLAHHTLLFTADWRENFGAIFGKDTYIPDPASIYVCRPSATDDSVAPEGHENLFVLVPVPADPSIGRGGVDGAGDASVEAAADLVIAQIAEWTGVPDLADRIVVRRTIAPGDFEADLHAWRGNSLGLAHTLGQSAVFRPRNASKKVENLSYAGGSVLPGIGLPMCLISAELVLKRLRGDRSTGPVAEPAHVASPGA
ncbi:zeta-carotene-forming phytoene desaturase [Microbacterium lemovicicum]|uniref:Zeta-carotene-forming phytoene desaturase n=1 Tax=Microbacterium lemovicicum TaxID=1072463 RepID=A0A3S9WAV5_9MICO|nr:phytoene desaturase family protein [Microbacterium lemovicicum]AZS37187.1 zeta-carotene-forming phytoene desaturase [Microbacterium lemovicicum]